MKNKFLAEMSSREYLSQCTDFEKLSEISDKKSISAYIGFDCTAKKPTCWKSTSNNDP